MQYNITAFIMAREGSKGVPNKNMIEVAGKPLIYYTIEAAQKSKYINNIFFSSESEKIIKVAEQTGLKITYRRPAELATDKASPVETAMHGLEWLNKNGHEIDIIILLQPTSPMRTVENIDKAIESFVGNKFKNAVSIHKVREHPYCMIKPDCPRKDMFFMNRDGYMENRQDFEDLWWINGAIYIITKDLFLESRKFIVEDEINFFEMNRIDGLDIDDYEDLKLAEIYLRLRKVQNGQKS